MYIYKYEKKLLIINMNITKLNLQEYLNIV